MKAKDGNFQDEGYRTDVRTRDAANKQQRRDDRIYKGIGRTFVRHTVSSHIISHELYTTRRYFH